MHSDISRLGSLGEFGRAPALSGARREDQRPARPRRGFVERSSLADGIYTQVRVRILTLQLAPGEGFTERQLATDLGASATPIREALTRLKREGLVEVQARSGYRVSPITVKDARDLFGLRTLLEGESAALAATVGGELGELQELDELCGAQYDPADPTSIRRFLSVNSDFHMAVAAMSGNRRLIDALRKAIDQLERYMHLGLTLNPRSDDIVHEHRDLVAAILGGDPTRARRLAVEQAHASHRMVLDGLLSSDAVLTANLGTATDLPLSRIR